MSKKIKSNVTQFCSIFLHLRPELTLNGAGKENENIAIEARRMTGLRDDPILT